MSSCGPGGESSRPSYQRKRLHTRVCTHSKHETTQENYSSQISLELQMILHLPTDKVHNFHNPKDLHDLGPATSF